MKPDPEDYEARLKFYLEKQKTSSGIEYAEACVGEEMMRRCIYIRDIIKQKVAEVHERFISEQTKKASEA
jgi:hypothetical protein